VISLIMNFGNGLTIAISSTDSTARQDIQMRRQALYPREIPLKRMLNGP
jgi:hypothetical protein